MTLYKFPAHTPVVELFMSCDWSHKLLTNDPVLAALVKKTKHLSSISRSVLHSKSPRVSIRNHDTYTKHWMLMSEENASAGTSTSVDLWDRHSRGHRREISASWGKATWSAVIDILSRRESCCLSNLPVRILFDCHIEYANYYITREICFLIQIQNLSLWTNYFRYQGNVLS